MQFSRNPRIDPQQVDMSNFVPMALPQHFSPLASTTTPGYFIYRDLVPGEAFDPTAPLNFFPPKDSDELFDALRAKFPHVSSHAERMRDAVIEFLVQERDAEAQRSSPNIAMDPASNAWASMSASTSSFNSSPDFLDMATPAPSDYPSSSQTPSYAQSSSYSASDKQSPPSLDQMTGVFSVSASAQPKQRVRRKMTEAEKIEYRNRRIVKACDKCARRKRKCHHNQPTSQQSLSSNTSARKVSKSTVASSASMKPTLSSQSRSTLSSTMTPFSSLSEIDFDQSLPLMPLDETMLDMEDPFASFTHNGDFFSSKTKHAQSDWTQDFAYAISPQDWTHNLLPDFELYSPLPAAVAGSNGDRGIDASTLNFPSLDSINNVSDLSLPPDRRAATMNSLHAQASTSSSDGLSSLTSSRNASPSSGRSGQHEYQPWNAATTASSSGASMGSSPFDAVLPEGSDNLEPACGSRQPSVSASRNKQQPFGYAEASGAGSSTEMPLSHRFSWGPHRDLENHDSVSPGSVPHGDVSLDVSSRPDSKRLEATQLRKNIMTHAREHEDDALTQRRSIHLKNQDRSRSLSESSEPSSAIEDSRSIDKGSADYSSTGNEGERIGAREIALRREAIRAMRTRSIQSFGQADSRSVQDALATLQNLSGLQVNSALVGPSGPDIGTLPPGQDYGGLRMSARVTVNATNDGRNDIAGNTVAGNAAADGSVGLAAATIATARPRTRAALRARTSGAMPSTLIRTPASEFVNANRLSSNHSTTLTDSGLAVNLVHVAGADLYADRLMDHVRYRDHHGRDLGQDVQDLSNRADVHGSGTFATLAQKLAAQPASLLAQFFRFALAGLVVLLMLQLLQLAATSISSWMPAQVGVRSSLLLLAMLTPSGASDAMARSGAKSALRTWKQSLSSSKNSWNFARCVSAVASMSVMA